MTPQPGAGVHPTAGKARGDPALGQPTPPVVVVASVGRELGWPPAAGTAAGPERRDSFDQRWPGLAGVGVGRGDGDGEGETSPVGQDVELCAGRAPVHRGRPGQRTLLSPARWRIASSNAGYFVLGGEGKTAAKSGPPGSAQVACVLVEQLASTGVIARTTTFDRESDYAAFIDAGIPSGGLWSGDRKKKSGKQARRWGGRAGEPFDPHYHTRRDRLDKLDHTALDRFTRAVAGTVAHFAVSTGTRPR